MTSQPQSPPAGDELDKVLAISGLEVYTTDDGAILPRLTAKGKKALNAYILAEVMKVLNAELEAAKANLKYHRKATKENMRVANACENIILGIELVIVAAQARFGAGEGKR